MDKIILTIAALIVTAAVIDNEHIAAALLISVIPLAAFMVTLEFMREKLQALKMAKHDFMRCKGKKHREYSKLFQMVHGVYGGFRNGYLGLWRHYFFKNILIGIQHV